MTAAAQETGDILVIEDDEATVDWMRLALEKDGWKVRHAADGKAAQAMIGKAPAPWLVTLDIGLPDVSGVELILAIKDAPTWARVPIVMVTATPKDENVNWAIQKGAKAYMVKPFKPAELQETVKKFARKPN
jgi:DNA-binding response OmpR family regulator